MPSAESLSMNKLDKLTKLAEHIDAQTDWWRFPSEEHVQGFMGTDTVFFVGDQPSTSEWGQTSPIWRALSWRDICFSTPTRASAMAIRTKAHMAQGNFLETAVSNRV